MELWTDRVTAWRHECCGGGEDGEFLYPTGEEPNYCPVCDALLCGCCNVAVPMSDWKCDGFTAFEGKPFRVLWHSPPFTSRRVG